MARPRLMIKGPAPDLDLSTLPLQVAGLCLTTRECEPAGRAYHNFCRAKLGLVDGANKRAKAAARAAAREAEEEDRRKREEWAKTNVGKALPEPEPIEFTRDSRGKKKRKNANMVNENLYEALEIGHIGLDADEGQIKKAYQKMLLKYHPDKQAAEGRPVDDADPRFMLVQKAWDILGDPARRRGYDSGFEFDDSIPTGLEDLSNEDNFYAIYGPVFQRNGRFSNAKGAVPELGDASTPIEKVQEFYKFWNRFESWRDFSRFDEHSAEEITGADSREEKRWMIRENETSRAKLKKKENARIHELVARAQKLDPRLIRFHAEAKKAKEDARKARHAAKYAKENAEKAAKEEAERAKAEADRIKKETEAVERKAKQNAKKAFKKTAKKLNKSLEAAYVLLEVTLDEREELDGHAVILCDNVENMRKAKAVAEAFAGMEEGDTSDSSVAAARYGVHALRHTCEPDNHPAPDGFTIPDDAPPPAAPAAAAPATSDSAPLKDTKGAQEAGRPEWTAAELSLLAKAFAKYPGGTAERWERIAEYVSANPETGVVNVRTKEECIAKSKSLAAAPAAGTAASS